MVQISLHELGLEIEEAFDKLLVIGESNEWLKEQDLTSEAERFQLWSRSLGLFADGHASLDYRVRDATFVKDRFEELLRDLAEHLQELHRIISGERKPAEELDLVQDNSSSSGSSSVLTESEASDGGDSFHEIDFRFQSLTENISSLYRLAMRIRNPKNRPSRTIDQLFKHIPGRDRSAHLRDREEFETNIVSHLLRQHIIEAPNREDVEIGHRMAFEDILALYTAPDSWLVRRTGKANVRRKQQLAYWKEHALRLDQGRKKPTKEAEPIIMEHDVAPSQCVSPSIVEGPQRARPSLATSATKLPALKPDDLKSVISHQSHVSTILDIQQTEFNWPSPPAVPNRAQYFDCPYCRTICSVKHLKQGAWETHIAHDLQAYHCTYEHCQDPNRLYGSKQEWLDHESQHNRIWYCQEHDQEFETQPDYTNHLEAKHAEFLANFTSNSLMSTAVTSSNQNHRNCPFCPTGFTEVSEMQEHIALHLIRLALVVISSSAHSDAGHSDESGKLSATHRPQFSGRARSIIGDFGLKHGLQKIPSATLTCGKFKVSKALNQLLVFYDHIRVRLIISFKVAEMDRRYFLLSDAYLSALQIPPRSLSEFEFIIEYYINPVSHIKYAAGSDNLVLNLPRVPKFYIRDLTSKTDVVDEHQDFTVDKQFSQCFILSILRPDSVKSKDFKKLGYWLNRRRYRNDQSIQPQSKLHGWTTTLQAAQAAKTSQDIAEWASSVGSDVRSPVSSDHMPLTDDEDGILAVEGLSWVSESEYFAAHKIATYQRGSRPESDSDRNMANIEEARRALYAIPENHPSRVMLLSNLMFHLQDRYSRTGTLSDLEETIQIARRAVKIAPKDHDERFVLASNFQLCLRHKYMETGAIADLNELIRAAIQAAVILPKDHTDRARLGIRFNYKDLEMAIGADLKMAIRSIREGVDDMLQYRQDNSGSTGDRGNRPDTNVRGAKSIDDLRYTLRMVKKAANALPTDHPDRAELFTDLGACLSSIYSIFGAMGDLEEATQISRQAYLALQDNHPDRAMILNTIGHMSRNRYLKTKAMSDLEEAIRVYRDAVNAAPSTHPRRIEILRHLTYCLHDRRLMTGGAPDEEEQIYIRELRMHDDVERTSHEE